MPMGQGFGLIAGVLALTGFIGGIEELGVSRGSWCRGCRAGYIHLGGGSGNGSHFCGLPSAVGWVGRSDLSTGFGSDGSDFAFGADGSMGVAWGFALGTDQRPPPPLDFCHRPCSTPLPWLPKPTLPVPG